MAEQHCSVDGCDRNVKCKGFCGRHYHRFVRYGDPLSGSPTFEGDPLSFVLNAIKRSEEGETGCILWPYSTHGKAKHGRLRFNGKQYGAHRLSLILSGVEDKPEMVCCHLPVICHNSSCINPRHLRFDTHSSNTNDMIADGTAQRGARHYGSKLTVRDVRAIREDKRMLRVIAQEYGVSLSNIGMIKTGKTWAWLDD